MQTEIKIPDTDLPDFFSTLPDDELKLACSSEDRYYRIISVGREASAGKLILLTGAGNFVTVKPKSLPEGRVLPSLGGRCVFFYDAHKEIDSHSLISGAYQFH
jgi:hypothetical protein